MRADLACVEFTVAEDAPRGTMCSVPWAGGVLTAALVIEAAKMMLGEGRVVAIAPAQRP